MLRWSLQTALVTIVVFCNYTCHIYIEIEARRCLPIKLMIFDPVFKWIQHLFTPQCLFSSVHLSRVEWQVPMPVFMSLIVWFEANISIKVYGCYSLTKCIRSSCWKRTTNRRGEYWHCKQSTVAISKRRIHILREILKISLFSLMYGTILMFIKFGTWHLNRARHLFHSFCCTTQCIF